jgi:hypothetical protein
VLFRLFEGKNIISKKILNKVLNPNNMIKSE